MAQGTPTKVKKRKKSVLKRAAQSIQRAAANRAKRTRMRSALKAMRTMLATGDKAAAGKLLQPTISAIDRAVAKGVLEKNTANRYKSRLTLALNGMGSAAAASAPRS